jgi:hypothetical protein
MRIPKMIAAVIVAATSLVATGLPASAQEMPVSSDQRAEPPLTFHQIINYKSRGCAGIPGGSIQQGESVIQWSCGEWDDHYWAFVRVNDSYQIKNLNSGQCMGISGASTVSGERVIQWPCGNWADHYWEVRYEHSNNWRIVNRNSNQCLAVPGGSTVPGERLIQWPCGDFDDHLWFISPPFPD